MEKSKHHLGILYAIIAYVMWGFLPIYWSLIDHIPAEEVLANRIVWAFFLMLALVFLTKNWTAFTKELKAIISNRKKWMGITFASLTVSLNWLVYIWAIHSGYVIQASLGYYINPLLSILLAIVVLKEAVTSRQIFAIIIAAIGVIYLTFSFGVFPWVSITLAFTFALYGLLKKTITVGAMFGLTMETMIVTPIAIIYLFVTPTQGALLDVNEIKTTILLIGTGAATAIPLLLFAHGAKRIPLAALGFLQFIAPTLMLILGVFLYKETFSMAHFISFTFIWVALIIFMSSSFQQSQTMKEKVHKAQ